MRTLVFGLLMTVLMISGFSEKSIFSFDFGVETAYAQEASSEVVEVEAVQVVEKDVAVQVASDLPDTKIEIPAWVGSVLMFIQSTPVVGPYIAKVVPFFGIAIAILTLLATLLMGLSGALAILSKGKATPKWVLQAKRGLDWLIHILKMVSTYNAQKDPAKK